VKNIKEALIPPQDEWLVKVLRKIESSKVNINEHELNKNKIISFERVAKKVSETSVSCKECQGFKPGIDSMADELYNLMMMPESERKKFRKRLGKMISHMVKKHKMKKKNAMFLTALSGGAFLLWGVVSSHWEEWMRGEELILLTIIVAVAILAVIIGRFVDKYFDKEEKLL
jgi:hypothetical protein